MQFGIFTVGDVTTDPTTGATPSEHKRIRATVETLSEMPVLIAATGGTERHSLVLEHAMRPMFSYLHAIVSPTGVYAATADFGGQQAAAELTARIEKAATDFVRLLQACGTRTRRDVFAEELTEMERLLGSPQPHGDGAVED